VITLTDQKTVCPFIEKHVEM